MDGQAGSARGGRLESGGVGLGQARVCGAGGRGIRRLARREPQRHDGRGSLSALIISGAVVILSPWIGSIAFLLFLLDGPFTRALRGKGA